MGLRAYGDSPKVGKNCICPTAILPDETAFLPEDTLKTRHNPVSTSLTQKLSVGAFYRGYSNLVKLPGSIQPKEYRNSKSEFLRFHRVLP